MSLSKKNRNKNVPSCPLCPHKSKEIIGICGCSANVLYTTTCIKEVTCVMGRKPGLTEYEELQIVQHLYREYVDEFFSAYAAKKHLEKHNIHRNLRTVAGFLEDLQQENVLKFYIISGKKYFKFNNDGN